METKEITAIAIKFLAIWLLIQIIQQAPILVFGINNFEGFAQKGPGKNFYITIVASYLVIGSMAAYFLIQLAGVYFTVSGALLIFNILARTLYQSTIPLFDYMGMCGVLFELAVGLSMLVKSTLWVQWFNKLRGCT